MHFRVVSKVFCFKNSYTLLYCLREFGGKLLFFYKKCHSQHILIVFKEYCYCTSQSLFHLLCLIRDKKIWFLHNDKIIKSHQKDFVATGITGDCKRINLCKLQHISHTHSIYTRELTISASNKIYGVRYRHLEKCKWVHERILQGGRVDGGWGIIWDWKSHARVYINSELEIK